MEPETFDVDALNFPELTTETTGNDTQEVKQVAETPKETVPEPVTKTEEKPVDTPIDPVTPEIKISDPPSQYEGESDLQYNIRKQIYDAGQAKAQAETPEEKSASRSTYKIPSERNLQLITNLLTLYKHQKRLRPASHKRFKLKKNKLKKLYVRWVTCRKMK